MTRSNRFLAAAAGLALASGAALADPASYPYDERYDGIGDYDQLPGVPLGTYERCDVRYRDSFVERIDGYDVTYAYAGREYVTRMPYDPGERIRVRVDVTPTDG